MKILCDFQDTTGGAPRSHLEHAKILKVLGFDVIAVISDDNNASFFNSTGIKVYYLSTFKKRKLLSNILLLNEYRKIISKENVKLIYANRVIHCQYLSILSDLIGVPILNSRAGGSIDQEGLDLVKIHNDKPYILYSDENLDSFLRAGFKRKDLYLIRNRLKTPTNCELKDSIENVITITITGSIKKETIRGVLYLLDLLTQLELITNKHIKVKIAGGNILKTKADIDLFNNTLQATKENIKKNIDIEHLGWVENITELQNNSHICIGKGRSVIEPAMMGKICFVVSEDGYLYRCKEETYSDLIYYNFSGRGIVSQEVDSKYEFQQIISNADKYYHKYLDESIVLKDKFIDDFSIAGLSEKLKVVVDKIIQSKSKVRILSGLKKYFKLHFYALRRLIRKA